MNERKLTTNMQQHQALKSESMSGVPISLVATQSPVQPRLPTPSPYSFSVASTTWSSRPPIQNANILLRGLAFVLSFGSALSLAALPSRKTKFKHQSTSFLDYPDLLYCFTINILVFVYSACQLFKGVCDIAHRGIFITDKVSDYISFICDQLAGYLLASASSVAIPAIRDIHTANSLRKASVISSSASSVAIPAIRDIHTANSLWKASVISVSMSFALFLAVAASTLLSGYKFCKRIMW